MDWTGIPLLLGNLPHFLSDIMVRWCQENLPAQQLESCDCLHVALAGALDVSEAWLCLEVKGLLMHMDTDTAYTTNNYLQQQSITMKQYISNVSTVGCGIDGLFLWLASRAFGQHINLIHGNGVWTSWWSAIPDLRDPVVVTTLDGFLFSPSCDVLSKKDMSTNKLAWDSPADVLLLFVSFPCVLNRPVKNCQERCYKTDLIPHGPLWRILSVF